MGKIFCIIGKSSTGKDTLYQRILGRHDLALRQIVSYTTRPIRAGEVDGIEYHFCTHEEKDRLLASGKVVEIRSYNTCYGIWDYFTVDDGNIDLSRYDYLVIGTIESFVKLRDYFSLFLCAPSRICPTTLKRSNNISTRIFICRLRSTWRTRRRWII